MRDPIPDADALFRAGREAFTPQAAQRERVLRSLTQSLGPLAERPLHGPTTAGVATARFPLRAWGLGGLGAVAVGAGVLLFAAHAGTKAPSGIGAAPLPSPTPLVAPESSASPPPSAADEDRSPEPPRVEHASSVARSGRSAARSASDPLLEEVRLLSQAEQELKDGRADEALRTLAEHERRFPKGALTEVRMAARVQSLCALGRIADAKTELTKLAHAYPGSPHLDRARRFCGTDVGAGP
jgi:hypothetical protein